MRGEVFQSGTQISLLVSTFFTSFFPRHAPNCKLIFNEGFLLAIHLCLACLLNKLLDLRSKLLGTAIYREREWTCYNWSKGEEEK